jgi:hypothetical protein
MRIGNLSGHLLCGRGSPRHIAVLNATDKERTGPASYYTGWGESPGVWVGSGMEGIDGLGRRRPGDGEAVARTMNATFPIRCEVRG